MSGISKGLKKLFGNKKIKRSPLPNSFYVGIPNPDDKKILVLAGECQCGKSYSCSKCENTTSKKNDMAFYDPYELLEIIYEKAEKFEMDGKRYSYYIIVNGEDIVGYDIC